jgi:hypothetical protein
VLLKFFYCLLQHFSKRKRAPAAKTAGARFSLFIFIFMIRNYSLETDVSLSVPL